MRHTPDVNSEMVAEQRDPQHVRMAGVYLDHLESLLKQERMDSYKRIDYMSGECQARLYVNEINGVNKVSFPLTHFPRRSPESPRSVMDPCTTDPSSAPSQDINPHWREKVSEWMYQVIDHFDLDRDVVGVGLFYLDKYLASNYSTEMAFQLAAIASIYLAVKLYSPEKIPIQGIATLGRAFSVEQIAAMEMRIAQSLRWHLHPPTAVAFLHCLQPVASECLAGVNDGTSNVVEFAIFLSELSVCEYSLIRAKPSSIAIASILSSMEYFRLPWETVDLFRILAVNACPNLDIHEAEVRDCSLKLKRIYENAMPNDVTTWGEEHHVHNIPESD